MKTSSEIRQMFFDFFAEKEHKIVASAPIVVKNDPTLLFTNAGMNQFKDYFLGNQKPEITRIADSQKCLRVSGKHNDLEEVGVDFYHHTMFEMLGNWSFGSSGNEPKPYFKKEAIAWSWELLTNRYEIPTNDLYITVFEGDTKDGLERDEETLKFWKKWIPEDHILFGNKKDNFWEMGDTGPCGPCTEIHYDARSAEEKKTVPGSQLVNKDHPEVIEIWNLVFIQYNRKSDNSLEFLPSKHVDTGMGFERLVRILQQKNSNYDTDIFSGTIKQIERISQKTYEGTGSKKDIAFRVVADHIRAVVFPVADGQLPSNTGAGYVIRRILRRAVRYYASYLDVSQPLLTQLVRQIADQFKTIFPEVAKQREFIEKVILEEENSFLRTLESGLKKIENIISENTKVIRGEIAFELFDTYGFPIDLTQLIASENGFTVDMDGFEREMAIQKSRSRAAAQVEKGDWISLRDGNTEFLGYEQLDTQSHILRYRKTESKGKEFYQIVLDKTPFYAEMGGQVGDTGTLVSGSEVITVFDTKRENNLILHFTSKLPADAEAELTANVDKNRRHQIELHHSATHLLHAALRHVLGNHVAQKGSLVSRDYLRFDFTHFSKLTDDEIRRVEDLVNEKIRENNPITTNLMSKEDALQSGAMALFGEKYGETVRVVAMDPGFSKELCGGTHAKRTGDMGYFVITNETAVGAGVRRIEAVTGQPAEKYVEERLKMLRTLEIKMKHPKDPVKTLDILLTENSDLKKSIAKAEKERAFSIADTLSRDGETIRGILFIGRQTELPSAGVLRDIDAHFRSHLKNYVAVIVSDINGKAAVLVSISTDVKSANTPDAQNLIKTVVAPLIKGGGGGNSQMATAGGQDVSHLQEVISRIKNLL